MSTWFQGKQPEQFTVSTWELGIWLVVVGEEGIRLRPIREKQCPTTEK